MGCPVGLARVFLRISDELLLFLRHMISKMRNDEQGSRVGIVMNGSPLFTGGAGSGGSEIRTLNTLNSDAAYRFEMSDEIFDYPSTENNQLKRHPVIWGTFSMTIYIFRLGTGGAFRFRLAGLRKHGAGNRSMRSMFVTYIFGGHEISRSSRCEQDQRVFRSVAIRRGDT